MRIIGDVHGEIEQYLAILPEHENSIQIGDMGIGFKNEAQEDVVLPPLEKHKFFRGNHDNPELCAAHPNYLGDWGYDAKHGIFWIAGAYSVDEKKRMYGRDLWFDEQLSYAELQKALDLYDQVRPQIVLSHDGPKSALTKMYHKSHGDNATSQALQCALEIHRPKFWFFGHHHRNKSVEIKGTLFRCIGTLSYVDI